jgi:hypothetical protein
MPHARHVAVVCLAAALCVTATLPAVTGHETPPPYPQLEPNDEFDRATEIGPRTLHGLRPITYTSTSPGPEIDEPSGFWTIEDEDEDVYAVDLDRGDPLPVTLYHDGSDGNLRYTVYDPSKSEVRAVDPDGNWQRTGSALVRTDRDIQRGNTTVTARCAGTYYVEVRNDEPTRAPYRLEVDDRFEHNDDRGTAPTLTEGTYEDLTITSYDEDFYRLDVEAGETIEATIDLTTQAHWERSPAVRPVRVQDPVTDEEWAPYNHTRWDEPSFQFRPTIGASNQSGDYRVNAVDQVKYDGLHRDKSSIEITESGEIYFVVRSGPRWTDPIDGAAAWAANSARYTLTITRTGSPSEPPESDGDGDTGDDVRSALERVDAQAANDDLGFGASQIGGEVVNLRVADRGTYSFELGENLEIEDVRGCGREDATLDVETDRGTVHEIGESDTPGREIGRAYRHDDLRVEGVGTVDAVKWTVLNRAVDVVDWVRR